MENGKWKIVAKKKIVKLQKLAKLVKIRETAARTKKNRIKTDTPLQKNKAKKKKKMLKKCEAMKMKIHRKLPLNVNGKSGQKLLDCVEMPEMKELQP